MGPASAGVMPAVGIQTDTATMAPAGRGMALCLGLSAKTAVKSSDVGLVIAHFQWTNLDPLNDRF